MTRQNWLTTTEIRAVFAEEIAAVGGVVSDTFDDGRRLFTRSVLPQVREIRAKDRVQGGVALRAVEGDVCVHPYVFRQVCSNGAIRAQAIQTRRIEAGDFAIPEDTEYEIREAVRACSAAEVFAESAQDMRSARLAEVDLALNLAPFLSRLASQAGQQVVAAVLNQFFREPDRSQYGLLNAVTAVARDTRDPALRWQLEELGGGILAGIEPSPKPRVARSEALLMR